MPFDTNDPKYQYGCCNAHVKTLARITLLVSYVIEVLEIFFIGDDIQYFKFPIVILGSHAVFKEKRIPLILFMFLDVITFNIEMKVVLEKIASESKGVENGATISVQILIGATLLVLQIFSTWIYWKLAKFIKYRESSEAKADVVTNQVAPAAPIVPLPPYFLEAPPPYQEKEIV